MIRNNINHTVKNVERISNRCIIITLSTSKNNNIKIINTYAPHMGYDSGERTKYWKEISQIMKNINNKDCIVWCTDNNGQISNEGNSEIKSKIGNWTFRKKE